MLTTIAIIVGVLSLLALWFVKCIIVTKPGHVSVVGDFGAKPEKILGPGWDLVFWPIETIIEAVSTERVNFNIESSKVICTIDPISRNKLSLLKNGITELEVKEISVTYQFFFDKPTNPDKLNAYFELANSGKSAQETIKEMLRDMVQSHLRDEVRDDGLLEAIAAQHTTINNVRKRVRAECENRGLPVQVIDIVMNEPMRPTEERIRKAMEDITVSRIERAAAEKVKNLEEYKAERDLAIKRKEEEANKAGAIVKASADAEVVRIRAEAKKVELKLIAEAMGVSALPSAEQASFWLSREALEAYKEMAKNSKSTYVVSGNVLGEIQAMLKNFSGGK